MNIALTKIYAVASANSCGRFSFARKAAAGCLLGCAVASAVAGPGEREAARNQPPPVARAERAQDLPAPRQFDPRSFEARAEEQRRLLQLQQEQNAQHADAARRNGRLTPDERRDLRRQINEAGQDLYPQARRR